jgi:hypothetical protein
VTFIGPLVGAVYPHAETAFFRVSGVRRTDPVRQVLFDPYQMAAVAQRLAGEGIPIQEYPQTIPNLTAATSNLRR